MRKSLALLAMLAIASTASATDGPINFFGGGFDGENGNEFTAWLQAEDFVLDGNGSLPKKGGSFDWLQIGNWDGEMQYSIFADAGGNPGALLASGDGKELTQTNLGVVNGFQFWNTTFKFQDAGVHLQGGTRYWLGIHMAADYNSRDDIYWATTNQGFGLTGRESYGGTANNWFDNGEQHAFSLYGVPEPASAALLVLGGIAALRRRR